MKFLVLSALIGVAITGNNAAFSSPLAIIEAVYSKDPKDPVQQVDAFKQQLSFHQRNIELLWQQYELGLERIANTEGSHAELDLEQAHLIQGYKNDIEKGIRVTEREQAIAKIAARYAKKHARRDALEKKEIVRLQDLLQARLETEKRLFEQSKKKYSDAINAETRPLLEAVEQRFIQDIRRAQSLDTGVGTPMAMHK